MKVLAHHIYEYKKGLRQLILHTLHSKYRFEAEARLRFFGAKECIEVMKHIGDKPFNEYTPEEDFILGVLLGYDKIQECNRYLRLCEKQSVLKKIA